MFVATMLCLLGFDTATKQWKEIKESVMRDEDVECIKIAKQPLNRYGIQFNLAKTYIEKFAFKQNFNPKDTKNKKDIEKSEVVISFESAKEFHK